jgi:hypothetical protein
MDHNNHTYNRPLGRALADTSSLGLRKAVLHYTGTQTGATFFRGSKPINGLGVSSNINIANMCIMPFGYGVGNHQMFVLGVTLESLIGKTPTKIIRSASQRLNSKIPNCSSAYTKALKDNIVWHCLIKKLYEVHSSNWSHEEKQHKVCMIDKAGKEYMQHAKKPAEKSNAAGYHILRRRPFGSGAHKCTTP